MALADNGPMPQLLPVAMFGEVPWTRMSHEDQVQIIRDAPTYNPISPAAYSTPPMSPAAGFSGSALVTPGTGTMSVASSAATPMRPSPYAAAMRAEFQSQMGAARVANSHVSFGEYRWVNGERVPVGEASSSS